MKKIFVIIVIIVVIGIIGVLFAKFKADSPYVFGRNDVMMANSDGSYSYQCEGFFREQEPRVAVWNHLDNFLQRLLTFHIA